jgi:hypothetical protein
LFLFVIMFYCIFLCISELFVVFSKKKCWFLLVGKGQRKVVDLLVVQGSGACTRGLLLLGVILYLFLFYYGE